MKSVYQCTGSELKIPNIVDSQGIYVFDEHGKRYMDLESGVWCVSVGHKNARVNQTIADQISTIMHGGFCYSNQILEEAANSVLKITGFKNGQCVFLCSGSEAIEISRQIAKHLTGKELSMTLHDSYLGSYTSVKDRSTGWYVLNWERCKTCPHSNTCDIDCEMLAEIPDDISDFVFEPGSALGFVRFPPKALIQNIVGIVSGNQGKVIVNEVTTGIGRTGTWFGYQHYDIEPDLIAIGKGVGNGYPVSVAAINDRTVQELVDKPFLYAQSHQNDPLGAAVVQEVISEIKRNGYIEQAEKNGGIFLSQLESLVDEDMILEVRGRGLMFGLDIKNSDIAEAVFCDLLNEGYIIGYRGSLFRIDPPLITSPEEFGDFISTLKSVLTTRKHSSQPL
jgi:acetylornithine aminotransferase